jgi:Protein of unknown function (DUF2950)
MHTYADIMNLKAKKFPTRRLIAAALVALLVSIYSQSAASQPTSKQAAPKTFSSPGQASRALYEAVQKSDEEAVRAILGAGPELTSSGDGNIDKLERERFAQKYQQMHRFVREPDGDTVLYIGAENWPFPIPLVQKNGKWHFDSVAGAEEVAARTIGENESVALNVCQDLAEPTQSSAAETSSDAALEFARKLTSANTSTSSQNSFHGYNFRVGSDQPAGVRLIAYPAEYGVSGVMTFVVEAGGSIYEKDLGPETAKVAPQVNAQLGAQWAVVR